MKRKKDEIVSDDKKSSAKKKKKDVFTDVEFRVLIKDVNERFNVLEKFLEHAEDDAKRQENDIVAGYCRSSGECTEIFKILEEGQRKPQELATIFRVLEHILVRIATDLHKYKVVGENIIKKFLAGYMKNVYFMLAKTQKSNRIKAALKLLAAMVIQGERAARDVFMQTDFSHSSIRSVLNRRDRKDPEDVRTCLLYFYMSFLLHGDNSLIRQFVESRQILKSIFNGMVYDRCALVEFILETLTTKVIENAGINKTMKIRVFDESSLKSLAHLYFWKGPSKFKQGKKEEESEGAEAEEEAAETNSSDLETVRSCIHSMLLELCCSFKNGINFLDKSLGTSGRNQNHDLSGFICNLKKPYKDQLIKELVIKILRACPDQLGRYLKSLQDHFVPRLSPSWIACMDFLMEIYSNQADIPQFLKMGNIPSAKLVQLAQISVIPPSIILNFIVQAVKKRDSAIVRHKALKFIGLVLEKVQRVVEYFGSKECTYPADVKKELAENFQEEILKSIPDLKSLASCWDFLLKEKSGDGEHKMELEETEGGQTVQAASDIEVIDMQITVIDVLTLYWKTFPQMAHEHFINLGSFLDGVKKTSEEEKDSPKLSTLYLGVLSLLANSDARMIPWNKVNEQGQSFVYLVLEMLFTTAYDEELASTTKEQVALLLIRTGLFEHNEDELKTWLDCLISCPEAARPSLLKYLEKVVTTLLTNPQAYTDQVCKAVQDSIQTTSMEDTENQSVASSAVFIESILEMDDTCLEPHIGTDDRTDEDDSAENTTVHSIWSPFSPLVPVSLKVLEKFTEDKAEILDYLCRVLTEVLHSQVDPRPFHIMLEQRGSSLDNKKFKAYVQSFVVGLERETSTPKKVKVDRIMREKDPATVIRMCWEKQPNLLFDKEIMDHIEGAIKRSSSTRLAVTKQIILCLNSVMTSAEKDHETAEKLVESFSCLLLNIVNSFEKQEQCDHTSEKEGTSAESQVISDNKVVVQKEFFSVVEAILKNRTIEECHVGWTLGPTRPTTNNVNRILEIALESGEDRLQKLCRPYLEKIQGVIMEGTDGSFEFLNSASSLRVLGKFVEFEGLVKMLNRVLLFPLGQLLDESGKHTAGGLALTLLLAVNKEVQKSDRGRFHPTISCFSYTAMRNLCRLIFCNRSSFFSHLHDFLEAFKSYAAVMDYGMFQYLLQRPEKSRVDVAVSILRYNTSGRGFFETWLEKCGTLKKEKMLLLPVVVCYLESLGIEGSKFLKTLDKLYWETGVALLLNSKEPEENTPLLISGVLVLLLKHKAETELAPLAKDLSSKLSDSKTFSSGIIEVLRTIIERLQTIQATQDLDSVCAIFCDVLPCLGGVLATKGCPDVVAKFVQAVTGYFKRKDEDSAVMERLRSTLKPHWSKIVKLGLRHHFENEETVNLLGTLASHVYDGEESKDMELQPETILEMIMSHSKFLPVILGEVEDKKTKESIVGLLHSLIVKNPKCCQQSHIATLIAAYGATLSQTDQKLLHMIHIYEKSGIDISPYRPYLWGPKSIEHLSVKKDLGPSLWKHATTQQVLEMLDEKKLLHSALKFPLKRTLMPMPEVCEDSDYYDPCFLLPLFNYLLRPDSLVNCYTFVERNCFGYTLAALSSHDHHMRGAAYRVLVQFNQQLEGSRFVAKDHAQYLLECIKNSLEEPNAKLPCIVTVFLVRAAHLLIHPVDHMYGLIQSFLLLKPTLDIFNIPEFYKLFHSSAMEFKIERRWILSLMADGLREAVDYRIFKKKYAFKLLLTFHDSPTSDTAMQMLVLKTVHAAFKIRKVAIEMVKTEGFLTWLNGVIVHRLGEGPKLDLVIDIICTLWKSVKGNRDEADKGQKCLPMIFLNEVLFTLMNILQQMSDVPNIDVFLKYVSALSSVLKELLMTEATHAASGYRSIAVKPSLSQLVKLVELSSQCSKDYKSLSAMPSFFGADVEQNVHTNKGNDIASCVDENSRGLCDQLSEHVVRIVTSCTIDLSSVPENSATEKAVGYLQSLVWVQRWTLKTLISLPVANRLNITQSCLEWFVKLLEHDCFLSEQMRDFLIEWDVPLAREMTDLLLALFSQISSVNISAKDISDKKAMESADDVTKVLLLLSKAFLILTDRAMKASTLSGAAMEFQQRAKNFTQSLTDAEMLSEKSSAAVQVSSLLQQLWLGAKTPSKPGDNTEDAPYQYMTPKSQEKKPKTPKSQKRAASPPHLIQMDEIVVTPRKKTKTPISPAKTEAVQLKTPKTPKSAKKLKKS